jgi:hypothetical protein
MSTRTDEHRYFLAAAVLLTVLVISAFGFEYRDLIHLSQFTVLVQVHALVMFAWVGLFLAQVALIVGHRPLWQRRLGVPTAIAACRLGGDHTPPGATPAGFLASAFMELAAFALLAGSGLTAANFPSKLPDRAANATGPGADRSTSIC